MFVFGPLLAWRSFNGHSGVEWKKKYFKEVEQHCRGMLQVS